MKAMTKTQARSIQRIYQRQGMTTWLVDNIYSGEEHLGFQYTVVILDHQGKEHAIYQPHERIGGTRTTII